jgi:hypothetical protein
MTIFQINLKGNSRGICMKAKEDYLAKGNSRGATGSSPLIDCSWDGQEGRLELVSGGQMTLKTKLNLKGDYQARVPSGQAVQKVRKGGWTM